MSDREQQISL